MRKLLSIFVLAAVAFAAQAVDVTVFDGTDQNDCVPIRATYYDYWDVYNVQFIYPAAELTALQGKEITSVKFYVANDNGNVMYGGKMALYIGTTTQSSFPDWSPSFISDDAFTKVAEISMVHGVPEVVFDFDEPWTYEGGNMVMMTRLIEKGTYSDYGYFYGRYADGVNNAAYGLYSVSATSFYPKATFTFVGEEPQGNVATTLAQANAMDDNAEFTFNGDAVVTVCWKGSVYLRDESGYGQIVDAATFDNGQVLSQGWKATKTSDNGWVKFTDAADLSASGETNAELAAAQVLTTFPDESMLNAYVVAENVTKSFFPIRSITLPDGSIIQLTGTGNQDTNGTYNIYGLIWKSGDNLVFEPVAWERVPEWQLGDVNHDRSVDVNDVTTMISYILGADPQPFFLTEANVDGDAEGAIDVNDVTGLISLILNAN